MSRAIRWLIAVLLATLLAGVGYWLWRQRSEERRGEQGGEMSIKVPARRIVDPNTGRTLIRLDEATQRRMGIVLETAKTVRWQKRLRAVGYAVEVPEQRFDVRSPWTGTLVGPEAGLAKLGTRIVRGQELGRIVAHWSPSDRLQLENQARDAEGTIREVEAELRVARDQVKRLGALGGGAVPARQLVEAEGSVARLEARLDAARQRRRAIEAALSTKGSEIQFPLVAAADGLLTQLHRRPGEVVSEGEAVFSMYDPRELWVSAMVWPSQLGTSPMPDEVELRFQGLSTEPIRARRVTVKPRLDRVQQAIEAIYAAANPGGRIPVGLQAEVRLTVGAAIDAWGVPRSAVVEHGGERWVYVAQGAADFAPQAAEVLEEDADRAVLRAGLPGGARVVSRGAQVLLSEEYKESIQLVEEEGPSKPGEPEQE